MAAFLLLPPMEALLFIANKERLLFGIQRVGNPFKLGPNTRMGYRVRLGMQMGLFLLQRNYCAIRAKMAQKCEKQMPLKSGRGN